MNEQLIHNANECYKLAEKKAEEYFQSLFFQVILKSYIPILTKDIESWKHSHIHQYPFFSLFSFGKKKKAPQEYHNYIQWLNYSGKLEDYLDRSFSYIYLRDLGKDLNSPDTQAKLRRTVKSLKNSLTQSGTADKVDTFSLAGMYRWAQKEQVESTMIWLLKKLKMVSSHIPMGMDAVHAQRKLIKIIAGVIIHEVEDMGDEIAGELRAQRIDQAIRLGYSYGLTYPFIDDLLDAKVLSDIEKRNYSTFLRTTLITGSVPELSKWTGNNKDLIAFIHSELREAFEYINAHHQSETRKKFFEQAYVFFQSQEDDRNKDLANANYTNEEIYIPIILKSAFSRLIARSVISAPEDEGFDSRTFYYGIYNQLADDFTDMFDDMKAGAVTPYTYYMKYQDRRPDLINPFELYWSVISHLIHQVYRSDSKTREVILDRAINGLKRFKERMGKEKYDEVMRIFSSGDTKFNDVIQNLVRKADDVEFFDKLLRDHIIAILKKEREELEEFLVTIKTVRKEINSFLKISKKENFSILTDPIIDAANYCLEGNGKRLRPIMTWVMGIGGYGLSSTAIMPLLRSLEYMHTASLIFDDLPSQDNASIRRGRPTVHVVYNNAIAELTGLFLTQKAVEEQASLDEFDPKVVLELIHYSSQVTQKMCEGQALDLESKGKQLTLDQLNQHCFYKTGIAFEAALIMPAILARANDLEMAALKKFSRYAGIAFQIKDDLLDVEGDLDLLGKPIGKDAENNNSTFVSVLGLEDAKKQMWNHYCLAMDALQEVPRNTVFLKQLLKYIVNRDQ
jgi:geranylgeranyl pyrophosphate synthase